MPIPEKLLLVSQQFEVSASRISAAFVDLSDDDFYRAPEQSNHMLWLLAHAANSRLGLVAMLGGADQRQWNELFSRGSQPGSREELPAPAEIRAYWTAAVGALPAQFGQMTDVALAQPSPRSFPIADNTLLGSAAFLAGHEMYHLGQMAALRKWLGHGQLVG